MDPNISFSLKLKGLSIFFTFLYLAAMAKPVLPVFEYVINQDYIAEYLCVNKDRPMLNCNGKCYLSKMLQEEQNEKQQNLPAIDLKEYPIGFVEILLLDLHVKSHKKNGLPHLSVEEPRQFIDSIFHPPNC